MSDQTPNLCDFVRLGELLFHLRNPQVAFIGRYQNDIQQFLIQLQHCNLTQTQTAAKQLDGITINYHPNNSRIEKSSVKELTTLTRAVFDVLYGEVDAQDVIITQKREIPKVLLDLQSQLGISNLEPHQEALRKDVIQCLSAQAYRPAIVVSWALGFDLLRWWIFSDTKRLEDFNILLKQRTQSSAQRQIVNYPDFFKEKESFVLQLCRDSVGSLQGFTTKTYRMLEHLLDDRNAFAHANFADATEHEAKSYIERLFRVLTNSPFK